MPRMALWLPSYARCAIMLRTVRAGAIAPEHMIPPPAPTHPPTPPTPPPPPGPVLFL